MPSAADAVCAPATPPFRSALALVRLSSPHPPLAYLEALTGRGSGWRDRRARLCTVRDAAGRDVDSGLITWFFAPHSATGEHVVEIALHGNPLLVRAVTDHLVTLGVRRAEPGEFTRRAVLNGRMDLVEAESVAALVDAGSMGAVRAAHRALGGDLSELLRPIRDHLSLASARLEGAIDFPEQVGAPDIAACADSLGRAVDALRELSARGRRQALWRNGVRVVIAGAPNAGKSTLFNRLIGLDKAITSDEPGTTRDRLEAALGLTATLVDTAGLREEAGSAVEEEGMRRTRDAVAEADLVLRIRDGRSARRDRETSPPPPLPEGLRSIEVASRADLVPESERDPELFWVSGTRGDGVDALRARIEELSESLWESDDPGPVSDRQNDALERAAEQAAHAIELLDDDEWALACAGAQRARDEMAALLGDDLREDVLDALFARFCIGK